ncbi:ABC transporter ATP-binding protein [Corynebacterium lizhenjunii]|uniref:ABC transporter ATP-binding protein n=1 Tax=Corynebacterium lizhenjunii TaxID=2709394 RepID=A0A7T0KET7_9CORY|nr:ABC transporter ATP-binding protein [Corynebacterium lizhenjunii]QPK78634.1 ABC transporter ATP-binding protein [Corynebacterium lizhenjunii]
MSLLRVRNLTISGDKPLVENLSFDLEAGGRLGLIGESGSGKSLTALAIMGLLDPHLTVTGSIQLNGEELVGKPLRHLRGKTMAMVFQEPMSALDPLMRIGKHVSADALAEVGLDPCLATRYPHQLSGGQRQRVLIAMAMAGQPQLLICDEPTTALDAATQTEILALLESVVDTHGTALLFISHDLRVVQRLCTDVLSLGSSLEELVAASQPGPPAPPRPTEGTAIELRGVSKSFRAHTALTDVSLHIARGERLGIVGGSGSGKSTLLKLIAGLDSPTSGAVDVHGRVHMVFQDPQGSLNPRLPIWKSVAEAYPDRAAVDAMLQEVGIDPQAGGRYPHQFSGGQRQRISLARAVISNPDILLADEAVSALDVSVRTQVLRVLNRLVDDHGLTLVFVTHDLEVLRQVCDRVAVISNGEIVEHGDTEEIWANPRHPYTRQLIGKETRG